MFEHEVATINKKMGSLGMLTGSRTEGVIHKTRFTSSPSTISYNAVFDHKNILALLASVVISFFSTACYAHEAWVLTPEQFDQWNAKPRPEIFTTLNATNISLTLIAISFIFVVIWLERTTRQKQSSQESQNNFQQFSGYATLGVRWALAVMLGMAALGISPRHGTEFFETATLVAPDLELRLLDGNWQWLAWAEGAATIALLFGIYVRIAASLVLCIDILGIYLFEYKMLAYAGIVGGVAIYLLISGAGKQEVHLPILRSIKPFTRWLEKQPLHRAQFLMRLLAGINLLYLGIAYKFMQPNLSMAFVEMQNVFTFGLEPQTFVFCMFLVETLAGLFMILGMLMRPLSAILFAAFMFLAYALGENPLGHIIFYGILWGCLVNGPGHWSIRREQNLGEGRSVTKDSAVPVDIVTTTEYTKVRS